MSTNLRVRLSAMIFLEYFIWGAWYVTMGSYLLQNLKFGGEQVGLAYGATAIAAMISPFFIGYIADRFVATEKMLAILHLLGGVAMWFASGQTSFSNFYPTLILYTLTYMPTLALTNSLAFHHISNPAKDFPGLRVWGTIGWILAGLLVSFMKIETTAMPFKITAAAAILMGVYCFTLPKTPPQPKAGKISIGDILGFEAFSMFKDRNFSVLVVASFLVCIPLFFYYSFCNAFLNEIGVTNAAGKMTFGQMSEILFMIAMPFFFRRLGVKKMIAVGILAWVLRYVLFAFGNNESAVWMLYFGIILHGICYDFFFVTGQIYVDEKAPNHIRGAAQGLITFATQGIGAFIGTYIAGRTVDAFKNSGLETHDWQSVWLVPAVMAVAVFLGFWLLFKEK